MSAQLLVRPIVAAPQLTADEWAEVVQFLQVASGELRALAAARERTRDLAKRLKAHATRCDELRRRIEIRQEDGHE